MIIVALGTSIVAVTPTGAWARSCDEHFAKCMREVSWEDETYAGKCRKAHEDCAAACKQWQSNWADPIGGTTSKAFCKIRMTR